MRCSSCKTNKQGEPKGCKNNGSCLESGCNKLPVFDWLANVGLNSNDYNYVEVRFKNNRKEIFINMEKLPLRMGEIVSTQAEKGFDVGIVSLTGALVNVQKKRKKIENNNILKIFRKAEESEISNWNKYRSQEPVLKKRTVEIVQGHKLDMKISDVEFQGDGSKATFYYTADKRVDFRKLIQDMSIIFNTRIEMKQIGLRQEASQIGGLGSCGRELCCSTWLTDFRPVNINAVRYQQLSINSQKLLGQCGKLKCCLNYELETYVESVSLFPKKELSIKTKKGKAFWQKSNIFEKKVWYAYENSLDKWHEFSLDIINKIITLNKKGKQISSLEEYEIKKETINREEQFEKENIVNNI